MKKNVSKLLNAYSISSKNAFDQFQGILTEIFLGKPLKDREAERLMLLFVSGYLTETEIASILTLLHQRGEAPTEIASFARIMKKTAESVVLPRKKNTILFDTCGTGGGSVSTFNVSTAVAFLVASAGIPVAKHGNKAITSKAGSADVLEALGVNIHLTPDQIKKIFKQFQISFLFAPKLHTSIAQVQGVRKSLPFRTVFNCLGPLANPMNPNRQLIGVYDRKLVEPMIQAAKHLGLERAMVVHGIKSGETLDEVSLIGKTEIAELKNNRIKKYLFEPKDAGLNACQAKDLQGGTAKQNAQILSKILSGKEKGPKADLVLVNAAASFMIADEVKTLKEGVLFGRALLNTGKPLKLLKRYAEASQKAA